MSKSPTKRKEQGNMFALGSFRNWMRLLYQNGMPEAGRRTFLMRILFKNLLFAPFRIGERLLYKRKVNKTRIEHEPLFILGHHRSGTTFLHTLLSRDPNFGFVTTWQAVAPDMAIIFEKQVIAEEAKKGAYKRAMDNVEESLLSPQEEEIAISNLTPYSFTHHLSFPNRMLEMFDRYGTLETINESELGKRNKALVSVLKKATYLSGGKRLVLKNPMSTAQIPNLLQLFPNAKFVHIYRNPYDLYSSLKRLAGNLGPAHNLHHIEEDTAWNNVQEIYRKMMMRYLETRSQIPSENLFEIRFEEFEKQPLAHIQNMYRHLSLPDFEQAEPIFKEYLDGLRDYQKNKRQLSPQEIKSLNEKWDFAFKAFGYEMEKEGSGQ